MSINTFKLEEYLGKYEFSAEYLLCCSDAESFAMQDSLSLASAEQRDLWANLRLGYTEVPGLPLLRETIAKNLYPGLSADNILMFAGAEDGIFCTLHTLINDDGCEYYYPRPINMEPDKCEGWDSYTIQELKDKKDIQLFGPLQRLLEADPLSLHQFLSSSSLQE